ncbi:MAG: glycosyltransferase family protein [Candidatus Rokubacteria bacterium]|nr:glycosyltransferase family protein [Candidatus Rokubacteria bacterium]
MSGHGRIVAIVQARTGSSRLPRKVLRPLQGRPMLGHIIERIGRAKRVDVIAIATTDLPEDQEILELARRHGVEGFAGPAADVLARYHLAAREHAANVIVRVGGDEPLLDPATVDLMVSRHLESGADYTDNCRMVRSFPGGLVVEVISRLTLDRIARVAQEPHQREHVTPYLYEHPEEFKITLVEAEGDLRRPELRLTVDTPEDFRLVEAIYQALWASGEIIDVRRAIRFLDGRPDLVRLNAHVRQRGARG